MTIRTSIMLGSLIACSAFTPGFAIDNASDDKQGKRAVIGEVVDARTVRLDGVAKDHHLLRVRNKEGKEVVVNIGAPARMAHAEAPVTGDRIVAVGKSGRINGKPIIFARYIAKLTPAGSVGGQRGAPSP